VQVPSCGASSWRPWGTTGCTALPQWTRPQSCDAGAGAAWASAAAGTQRPHALSCPPDAPPQLVCALTQSSRPGQVKTPSVQCLQVTDLDGSWGRRMHANPADMAQQKTLCRATLSRSWMTVRCFRPGLFQADHRREWVSRNHKSEDRPFRVESWQAPEPRPALC
jgi:hypothetical protein